MKQFKLYYPYKSDKPDKKFFVFVNDGESNTNKRLFRKIYFGSTPYEHYTEGHLDNDRRKRYELRHKDNEKWGYNGVKTAGFWSYWLLWKYKTYDEAYNNIKKMLKRWGFPAGATITI